MDRSARSEWTQAAVKHVQGLFPHLSAWFVRRLVDEAIVAYERARWASAVRESKEPVRLRVVEEEK